MKTLDMITALLALSHGTVAYCPLPASYQWSSSGPLAQPGPGIHGLRDNAHAIYNGQNLIYSTTQSSTYTWGSISYGLFSNWTDMASTSQTTISDLVFSPSIFLFRPKNIWMLTYQWGPTTFSFETSSDPSDPKSWSTPQPLFRGSIPNSSSGPTDPAVISDGEAVYLFFCGSNGAIYRANMPVGKFPGDFGTSSTIILQDTTSQLLEGVKVYRVSGEARYLMIVEAIGRQGRYFRSFTATTLDGHWEPQAATETSPFAGKPNSGATWTNDISGGELIRSDPDETMTIDACELQFLHQGRDPKAGGDFFPVPWRPGLLTLA
ncbi:glycoside hydrolase family 62 protein [Stachybotrys elegans]|uniref:Alpha-L-arabinofuranosidase n=1 Tax=Stachybotrys elegans TaxID=80388 RepID=A0A8K0SMY4_9HYPO|nr:glycoside hydrolase family 62 protein [Stachybotrys elegans]